MGYDASHDQWIRHKNLVEDSPALVREYWNQVHGSRMLVTRLHDVSYISVSRQLQALVGQYWNPVHASCMLFACQYVPG